MKSRLTIQRRLFFAVASILMCSYTVCLYFSFTTIQRVIEKDNAKELTHTLLITKNQINARMELVLEALKLLASTSSVKNIFPAAKHDQSRKTANLGANSLDYLEMLTLVDSGHNVITRINGVSDVRSFLQKDMVNSLFERKQPILTTELVSHEEFCREVKPDVCRSLPDSKDVIVQLVLLPVMDSRGKVIGMIAAGENRARHQHLTINQPKIFDKTIEVFLTRAGERLASTITESTNISTNLEPRVIQFLKNGFPFIGTTILNGRKYEVIAEPIQNHRGEFIGSVVAALGKQQLVEMYPGNLGNLIFGWVAGIIISLGFVYIVIRKYTAPLRELANVVRGIESENFAVNISEKSTCEFQTVAVAINGIAEVLRKRDSIIVSQKSELATLNNEFEKRVSEKVRQFEAEAAVNKSIIMSIMDGLVVADQMQKIVELNPMAEKLFSIRATDLIGKTLTTFCRQAGFSELAVLLDKISTTDPSPNESVVILKHYRKRLRFAVTVLTGEAGRRGFLLGIRDVTSEGEVERLKSGFIAKISHDLKTPLTSMKGSLQFILKKGKWLTGAEREMLDVCLRNTERLIDLVASILEISRIEAGQMIFSMRPVQVGEIVLYAIEEIKEAALLKNVSVVNDVPMDLPKIYGDYERLNQVLSELLSHAVTCTPENSIITLSATVAEGFLAISVTDGAKTISEEQRDILFSRFQQIGSPEDGEFFGSGLGLAICKEIIERHGGGITNTPGVAGGNVYTFTVPLYGEYNGTEQNTHS